MALHVITNYSVLTGLVAQTVNPPTTKNFASKWVFINSQNENIDCEWCNASTLEKVRSVYVAGFLHHDFMELNDDEAKKEINAVWTRRIDGYKSKFDKQPSEIFFATAKKNSEFIGFVIFEMRKQKEAYVTPLVIHPSMQRTGLGKELLFSILKKVPDLQRLSLITMRSNKQAINFNQKNGFKEFQDNDDHGYPHGVLISFERTF